MRTTIHHLVLLLCSANAMLPGLSAATEPHTPIPVASMELDHVIAWVPVDQASTAGVAQALVHLSLDKALRAAEAELCHGTWQLSATTMVQVKPRPALAPAALGAHQAWYYRLSRVAQTPDACSDVDHDRFQRTISRHLPTWILIRPAHQLSLWQQGNTVAPGILNDPGDQQTVALQR